MPLNLTTGGMSARGFGFTTQGYYNLALTIASNTSSYNVYNAAIAAGWTGTNPLNLNLTINSGVTVSGTGNNTSAAIVLNNLFAKSIITINNNGTVVGNGGAAGFNNNGGAAAIPYPGNPTSVTPINFPNAYTGTGYPIGPGAGGSTPGNNNYSGSGTGGAGTAGGSALYLASNVYLILNNSASSIFVGGGGGAGGQAGNNAGGGAGANGGYCIEETGTHPIAIVNNVSGGVIASGGGASGGWGNRSTNDGVGGKPGYGATHENPAGPVGGNYGGDGISPGLATNNTGTTLINTTGQFTLSPAV
jgi:hypothetical protein